MNAMEAANLLEKLSNRSDALLALIEHADGMPSLGLDVVTVELLRDEIEDDIKKLKDKLRAVQI